MLMQSHYVDATENIKPGVLSQSSTATHSPPRKTAVASKRKRGAAEPIHLTEKDVAQATAAVEQWVDLSALRLDHCYTCCLCFNVHIFVFEQLARDCSTAHLRGLIGQCSGANAIESPVVATTVSFCRIFTCLK